MRLDIGWRDLALALGYCVTPSRRTTAVRLATQSWSSQDDFLITLSVRSAFDLMLRALQLPHGSEVLLSALTVPDMVRIVQMHGLIPVPVVTDENGNVDAESLRRAISSRTRMIVVAHLFGGWVELEKVLELADDHGLFVVEDCAQSFSRVGDSAHSATDAAMFSFGPIKTATGLGGAVVRVKSPELRERMAKLLAKDPIQSRASFMRRIARFSMLKLLSGRYTAALMRFCVERIGRDFDSAANSVVRGFATSNLLPQLRRQPSSPLLRLLGRRWRSYDFARIDTRIKMGRFVDSRMGREHPASHSYWVYPVFVQDPIAVRDRFRAAGFDATCQARMTVVPPADDSRHPTSACDIWKHVVFLPWYPEMPQDAVDKMASLIRPSDTISGRHMERQNHHGVDFMEQR
jgi:perosamine synthetase